ncbi:hypothetical protein DPMN_013221 [Dreissena polymorpha]|uniref:Uncharacterized protein n=1 Tax=Dreissena polymorpha TaxID=45954 RepID=A0A9D4S283_DREPO|nr:hypothetical protein DPMN_013221 [Dreissena polymorpha]
MLFFNFTQIDYNLNFLVSNTFLVLHRGGVPKNLAHRKREREREERERERERGEKREREKRERERERAERERDRERGEARDLREQRGCYKI